ncbi:hypothetical protein IQ243_09005 [Nostocales cyanobacterium LEGE 11386]|nr:hypothetical protein [Nostocales cyanobacterium LEGE 11386]
MHPVILIFWVLLMLWLAFLVLQGNKIQGRYHTTRKKSIHQHKPRQRHKYQDNIPKTGNWHKLLTLVHGDAAAAERLVKYEQNRNPDRSVDWCVEKALWQLKRDRR